MKTMILAALTVLAIGASLANAAPRQQQPHAPGSYTGLTTAGD